MDRAQPLCIDFKSVLITLCQVEKTSKVEIALCLFNQQKESIVFNINGIFFFFLQNKWESWQAQDVSMMKNKAHVQFMNKNKPNRPIQGIHTIDSIERTT